MVRAHILQCTPTKVGPSKDVKRIIYSEKTAREKKAAKKQCVGEDIWPNG